MSGCSDLPAGCIVDGITSGVGDAVGGVVGGVVDSVAGSAWNAVCQSFADAATTLLTGFAKAFVAFPSINPASDGITGVYGISLGIAAVVAGGLFLLQVARTVLTHDGQGLAHGIVGLGKAALAFMATLTVTAAAIEASNELTAWIVDQTFDEPAGLEKKLTTVFTLEGPGNAGALLLVLGLVGIVLTLVLWFELLLSNAAVAVLIGTSPIAAAGQVSEATKSWWPKLVSATAQLIILKPVIALVFAVGFGIVGDADANSEDVGTLLAGMLILVLAALAWPAIARFFTFASVAVGGGSGLAGVIGFAAGRSNGAGGGAPAGAEPEEFGQNAEARTMSAFGARSSKTASAGASGAGGASAGAAGAMPIVAAGLALAQRAANSLVGRIEQTAGNAGLDRHNPHPAVAGYPGYQPMSRHRGEPGTGAGTTGSSSGETSYDTGPSSDGTGSGGINGSSGTPEAPPSAESHAPPPPPTSDSPPASEPGTPAALPPDPGSPAPASAEPAGAAGPGSRAPSQSSRAAPGRVGGSGWPGSPPIPAPASGGLGARTPAPPAQLRPAPAPTPRPLAGPMSAAGSAPSPSPTPAQGFRPVTGDEHGGDPSSTPRETPEGER
jgi:hypothetical protein